MSNTVISDLETVASQAASVLTAGGPVASAVTAVANALTQGGKVAETLITGDQQNKSANEKQSSLEQYEKIMDRDAAGDGSAGPELGSLINGMLLRQGIAIGPLSGRYVRVPMEHLTALVQSTADGTAAIELLTGIEQTLKGARLQ